MSVRLVQGGVVGDLPDSIYCDAGAAWRGGEVDRLTLCDILFEPGLAQPNRFLLVDVDRSLRVVSSVRIIEGDLRAEAPFRQGRSFDDLFRDTDKRAGLDTHIAAVLGGGFSEARVEFIRDGLVMAAQLCFMPRFHGPQRQRGFILLVCGAAQQRRILERAGGGRPRLSAILDNAADAVLMIDERGRVEDANASALNMFGWSYEELVGGPVTALMAESYREAHQGYIDRYLRTGATGVLNVGPRALPAVHKDGRSIPIELSVGEGFIGGERKFIGVCRDISLRLAKDRELREVNDELRERVSELELLQVELERSRAVSADLAARLEAAGAGAEVTRRPGSGVVG